MRKGSPRDYHPERGFQGPAQNTHTGEPHESRSLYRIRRPQEKYQLLRQNGCRRNCEGRQAGGRSSYSHGMGRETDAAVAWRHGGNAFQRVDLRHPEALRRAAGDGASRENESHYLWKEEERQNRRAHHCRLAALQPAARVLRDAAGAARFTASVALSQPGSPGICTDAKQNRRPADGNRQSFQQRKAARQEVLRPTHSNAGASARVGQRPAANEPQRHGDVRDYRETAGEAIAGQPCFGPENRAAGRHSRRGRDHGPDLGPGNRRSTSFPLQRRCHELLRPDGSLAVIGGQTTARSYLQTTQRLAADHIDRGSQAGPALESATGRGSCPRTGTWSPQSSHPDGGAQAGGLSAGGGQEPKALRGTRHCLYGRLRRLTRAEGQHIFRMVSDLPAGPCVFGHCAKELEIRGWIIRGTNDFKSRMHLTVCFKAGRFTLTQTSWTSPELRSRKWMSGYAAALAAKSDRRPFENRICAILALRESFRLSAGEPPFPLDNYLLSIMDVPSFLPAFSAFSAFCGKGPPASWSRRVCLCAARKAVAVPVTGWRFEVNCGRLSHGRENHRKRCGYPRFITGHIERLADQHSKAGLIKAEAYLS